MYHVIKFSLYFSFTVYCFYTKISSFMLVLSTRIVLDFFYLLIFYSEKFSTDVCRLPYAVNVNLNLSIVRMTTCALNLWLNKFSSCKLWHNVAQSTPEFWFLQQTFNFVTCVKNCHTSHRVIGRFTRTKSAGKMLSSRAHLGQLFLRCGTFQDFGHQYLVKDTTFFSEIDKGDMWKENWSARKGHRYRRVTVRFSVVNKSKEGRIKVWRWNEHSALQVMCDAK